MLETLKPAVIAPAGTQLDQNEIALLRDHSVLGVILFRRNIATPDQVKGLVAQIRDACGWPVSIWIDQEGGRVQRMTLPHWPRYLPAAVFGQLYAHDPARALKLLRTQASLISADLRAVGVDVDCWPVLDIPQVDADAIIGDRAFATDIDTVVACSAAVIDTLMQSGVVPVMKHIPGHGRALQDSHLYLPSVEASDAQLWQCDMAPFIALNHTPVAMVAHIVYRAWDDLPATLSPAVITILRQRMGYEGLLVSDDLAMKALDDYGSLGTLCRTSQQAGIDVMLYCPGDFAGNQAVLEATEIMTPQTYARWQHCQVIRERSCVMPDQQQVADYWQWANSQRET